MIIDDYLFYTKEYKQKYGEKTVVLMQVGKFFELYSIEDETDSDIYKIADLCNISISKKNKSIENVNLHNPLMAGFPLYVISKYQNILLQNNYTIVMIEQTSEAPQPIRELTEILSPGMNVNINSKKSNYMMTIYYEKIKDLFVVGIAGIDISTGSSFVYEAGSTKDDLEFANNEVFRLIISYNPCELIFLSNDSINEEDKKEIIKNANINDKMIHYIWNSYEYIDIMENIKYQKMILTKVYNNIKNQLSIIESLNLELLNLGRTAFCCLLQFSYNHNADITNNILKPHILGNDIFLNLEYDSALQLNLISLNNNEKSLINILNRCNTSFGSRLFKERLLQPIIDKNILNERYGNIEKMLEETLFKKISKYLNKILDLERIKRKIIINKLHPHEWCGFDSSLENVYEVFKLLELKEESELVKKIIESYNILNLDNASKYNVNEIKGNIFNEGVYKEIDELENEYNKIYQKIKEESDNISKLVLNDDTCCKIEYSEKEGYYIYITKKRYDTAKNISPSLINKYKTITYSKQNYYKLISKELERNTSELENISLKISELTIKYYKNFIRNFIELNEKNLENIINKIANIDISCCNARNAYEFRYYRPKIINNENDSGLIKGKDIRHPIIERLNTNVKYIGNDIELSENGILLYGINASGKSSLMKTIGLNIIMAQSGMYVPSCEFYYKPYHHIFTRISGADNIYKGMSSFTVEMSELRNILQRCDKYSLVLGDEVCNGTESLSGISIVAAAIDKLINKLSSFIFATHLHELVDINIIKHNIKKKLLNIFHLHITINNDVIHYERKIKIGKGSSIYGIEVCKALDMPKDFMLNAEKIRKEIQGYDSFIIGLDKSHYNKKVLIDKCNICGKKVDDIHHINYQSDADTNGYFKNYHKNIEHNLVPLCKKCHQKEHNNEISIKGFIETSEGIKLNIETNEEKINQNDNEEKKNTINIDNNLTDNNIENIKKYILYNKKNEWFLRNTKTSKFKLCDSEKKIIAKINKLIDIKLDVMPTKLYELLLDNNL
tara:strand:- start:2807 stop:5872 length:3066 start_codon:yes stop_codon:yes gene_type:complete